MAARMSRWWIALRLSLIHISWLQTWYELYAKPQLRFSTAEYYRRGIELHITPRIGDIPLKKLTGRDLQWLYKDLQEHGRLRESSRG